MSSPRFSSSLRHRERWLAALVITSLASPLAAIAAPVGIETRTETAPETLSGAATPVQYHRALDPHLFPVPAQLRPAVEFWRDVFTRYTTHQVVLHDHTEMDVVYDVVELGDVYASDLSDVQKELAARKRVREAEEELSAILKALGGFGTTRAPADLVERVRAVWAGAPEGQRAYLDASQRVRSQTGLKDTFANAIEISGMFMPGIERVLREEGVPLEVRCMPFVESMFNYKARSKVGASGAWQFTASTGRLYLTMNAAVDERSDVLLAARGAARLLTDNHERLGTWPLALTAYNHGAAGIRRAVRKTGTDDIGRIAREYRSRSFGFASRNFYASFVAAVIAYADRALYFPDVEPWPEMRYEEVEMTRYVSLPQLAKEAEIELGVIEEFNPALKQIVYQGGLLVPKGYPLRVPPGRSGELQAAFDRLGAEYIADRQSQHGYEVRPGDTLGAIARRHGTSIAAVQQANGLPRADRIYVGQRLVIPGAARGGSVSPAEAQGGPGGTHVVRPSENLSRIAAAYGVSADSLADLNDLTDPDLLRVGQRLRIPGGADTEEGRHVVRNGDTLFDIAVAYGTSVEAIRQFNRLGSNLIRVGQILLIPPS